MRYVALMFIALLFSSCATDSATTSVQAGESLKIVNLYPKFKAHMDGCTQTYGFDPKTAQVAENALAPGEAEWRKCVYQGIDEYVVAYSGVPMLYKQIVLEDQEMTAKIGRGEMTRSARRDRLDTLIKLIRSEEINSRDLMRMRANELDNFVQRQNDLDEIMRMQRQAAEASRLLQSLR